ncbi:MAG TPA: ABC transporter ATP-binding protein [Kouleothrix sp.]|uniref:ABC transporter ATP-binding protein n=1 Tax=Kouleothrix sp. TaxID=2779161 RepID=UPI002C3C5AAD|nr:ABC transporter ATP-binding protein [Kouleothrix sp.]HRC75594.1 ABC transporter ATP-binding protein [Kouleothrix sp.]
MAFLDLKNVRKGFAQSVAVENFNLEVERGEFISFLGPSGCGKTTTLRMIAGFETPTSGTIRINGADVTGMPPNRRNVGMVFQSYALFPNMTVADNIGFGLKVARKPAGEIAARVEEMLRTVHLPEFGARYPYQLSGGQQQRVALARALAIQPQVLLLDEPLSALDAKIRVSLRNEIRSIQRQLGITTIYVTHDQEEALSLSDRIVVMSNGRIEQIGTPFEIYNFPTTRFVASFVGTLNVLSAHVASAAEGRLTIDGQEIRASKPLGDVGAGQPINLALRPEIISIDGAADSVPNSTNRLAGTVEDVMFLGPTVRVRVRFGEQALQFDEVNNPHLNPPARGQQITVSFPPEACLILGNA